jgi:hypothetical protein
MSIHRKVWENYYGKIPCDEFNRTYEIHHIDGNRNNNDIENLKCISIKEHLKIHKEQKDFGACSLIMRRMGMSPEEISNIQKGSKRPGVGGVKKGTIPWNKGKTMITSQQTKEKRSKNSTGELNSKAKLTEKEVIEILELYFNKPDLPLNGKKQQNGRVNSYEWSFSKHYCSNYEITSAALMRLLKKKSWKHVWKKYEI